MYYYRQQQQQQQQVGNDDKGVSKLCDYSHFLMVQVIDTFVAMFLTKQ